MSYVVAVNHNRGVSYWISYDSKFGAFTLAKRYESRERAEACLGNIAEYLAELMEETMYSYLGYDRTSLRVLEILD